jgi:hypothetical protein
MGLNPAGAESKKKEKEKSKPGEPPVEQATATTGGEL